MGEECTGSDPHQQDAVCAPLDKIPVAPDPLLARLNHMELGSDLATRRLRGAAWSHAQPGIYIRCALVFEYLVNKLELVILSLLSDRMPNVHFIRQVSVSYQLSVESRC